MSVQKNKYITPIFDTMLDKAISHVQDTFFQGDTLSTWQMLKKLVYVTADKEIIEECEKFISEVDMEMNKVMVKRGYAQSDILKKRQSLINYLNVKNIELFKKITLLLLDKGYLKRIGSGYHEGRELGY